MGNGREKGGRVSCICTKQRTASKERPRGGSHVPLGVRVHFTEAVSSSCAAGRGHMLGYPWGEIRDRRPFFSSVGI